MWPPLHPQGHDNTTLLCHGICGNSDAGKGTCYKDVRDCERRIRAPFIARYPTHITPPYGLLC